MQRILRLKSIAIMMLISSVAWSQTRTVTGKVTSADEGTPIPGVNIILKGTTNGATTDSNGVYTISIPESGGTLIFSFIGMSTKEVAVDQQTIIDTQMTTDISQFSEVVVVGYGIQNKRDLNGSIA